MAVDPDPAETVTVEVAATLDDQVRCNQLLLASPEVRRLYRRRLLLLVAVLPPVGLLSGVLMAWAAAGGPESGAELAATLWSDRLLLLRYWLGLAVLLLAIFAVQRAFPRRRLRRALRPVLLDRAGVDPADPTLAERACCTFGPHGFTSTTAAAEVRIPWAAVRSLDETKELMVVRTGLAAGFVLPRRDMTCDQQAAVRRVVARYVA